MISPLPITVVRHGTNLAMRFVSGLNGRSLYLTMDNDIPDFDSTYWVAGEVAARMSYAGIAPDFIAPGPCWLKNIDKEFTGRSIHFGVRDDLPCNILVHAKPAELKLPYLQAAVYSREEFISLSCSLGVNKYSRVQWTTDILNLDHEHRFFILNGEVATSSPYNVHGAIWHPQMTSSKTPESEVFVQDVLVYLEEINNSPPAFVLDVAYNNDTHKWIILEANPAWSSGMYGVDMNAMLATLDRACHARLGDDMWLWHPDIEMKERAANMPLMKKTSVEDSYSIVKMIST